MIRNIIAFLVLSAALLACTERIDVQLDNSYSRLVVDGNISPEAGPYRIALTSTASYFYNEPAPRVVNAVMSLNDGFIDYPLTETVPGVSGIYETDSGFSGVIGRVYSININLPQDIGGFSSYQATDQLHPVTKLDSIRTVFHPEWGKEGVWTIQLWAQEPGDERNYYMFNVYRNGILLTDTLNKKVISDDALYNGSYMNGVDAVYLNNSHKWETIYPGDTVVLQMSGITQEYFNFINQVRQAGFNIPFFSGPPANVEGNVNNGAVGFFSAYSNSYAWTIVK
ncbi:MAG: DUF4249 domain-containing protein [bacterium]